MRRNKKKNTKLILLLLLVCITLGYAALRTGLNINGTAKISNATWDVHFENVEATQNSNVTPTVAPSAPAESKLTEISYDVSFNEPGEIYEFTVDVKNGGTIDAMVESIETKLKVGDVEEEVLTSSNLPSYLNYSVTYSDDVEIQNNHLLASNTSEKIKVRVEFKRDITNDELAEAANKVIKFTLSLNYMQADDNAEEVRPTSTSYTGNIYTFSGNGFFNTDTETGETKCLYGNGKCTKIGDPIDGISYEEDANTINSNLYLRHMVVNNIIKESYVIFVVSDEMAAANPGMSAGTYELRGGINESSATDKTIYETNKDVIKEAFDYENHSSRCHDYSSGSSGFYCEVSGLYADARSDGWVDADDRSSAYCDVRSDGGSSCDK